MTRIKNIMALFTPIIFIILLLLWQNDTTASQGTLFVDSGQIFSAQASFDVALADLDGDTDLDIFVLHNAPNAVWINQGGTQGGTAGVFQDSGQNIGSFSYVALALGDLDGDNDLDAFLTRSTTQNDNNQVWINQGGAQAGTPGIFQWSGQIMGDGLAMGVALGDVDGDGDLDAYLARSNVPDQVWLNDGSGQFSNSGQNLDGAQGWDVVLGDVDGDDDLDAFVVNVSAGNTVWLNQGGAQGGIEGEFQDSGQSLGSAVSFGVALVDVDDDMDLDAFVVNAGANVLWLNQGGQQGGTPGIFADSGQTLGTNNTYEVAAADFDGDGDVDMFTAEQDGANHVWINQGGNQGGAAGAFQDSELLLGSSSSYAVAVGDVDGDSDSDAFVANFDGADRLYLNQNSPIGADLLLTVNGPETVLGTGAAITVHVQNLGPELAVNTLMQRSVMGAFFSNWTPSQGSCSSDSNPCTLGNIVSGNGVTVTVGVGVQADDTQVYQGSVTISSAVASSEVDPDVTNNDAVLTTHFYECKAVDGCLLDDIVCLLYELNPPAPSGSLAGHLLHNDNKTFVDALGTYIPELALYYHLRDDIFTTPVGQHYRQVYYTHSDEVSDLVLADTAVWDLALAGLFQWESHFAALVAGEGDTAIITTAQIQAVEDFLNALSNAGSPALQQAIAEERANLPPFDTFIGMTMEQARGEVIGYAAYMPVVLNQ